jgi:O-antigen/teichoic acid export membrane protein
MAIRSQIKSLGFDTVIYGIGNVLTKLVAFILIPIYTRFLEMSDVGYYVLLETFELLVVSFISSGMQYSLWRFLPKSEKNDLPLFIISGFVGTAIASGILLSVLSIYSGDIAGFIGLDMSREILVKLAFLNIIFTFGFRYFLYFLQFKRKTFFYIALTLFQLIGICGLTIWLVVFKGSGLYGLVIAKTITLGILFFIVLISLVKETKVFPTVWHYSRMAKYGIPLIPMLLVFPVLNVSDRFFLNIFVSPNEIGIYSVAYRIGMILQMVLVLPLQRSWLPMMYQMGVESGENKTIIRDALFYYAVIGGILLLSISTLGETILKIASTDSYLIGARFIPIISCAYFFNGFRVFFISGAAVKDKNKKLGAISLSGIALNMVLNWVLIAWFGTDGAAWATALSFLYLTASIYFFSQKEVYIDWNWHRLAKLAGVILILFIGLNEFTLAFPTYKFLSLFLCLIIYPLLLVGLGIIGQREMNGVQQIIAKLKIRKK